MCYIPKSAAKAGNAIEYKFFIENDSQDGWENTIPNRQMTLTNSLIQSQPDTTLHWVYFDESNTASRVEPAINTTPSFFDLLPNYPNPFNSQTRIIYEIQQPTYVSLRIYNVQGELVATLVERGEAAGLHSIAWNGHNNDGVPLASGIYFIHLQTNGGVKTRKILLLR